MGDIKIAVHVQNGKAASKFTVTKGSDSDVALAIAHLEINKNKLLDILNERSDNLTGKKSRKR